MNLVLVQTFSTLAETHINRGVNIVCNYDALNCVRYSVQCCLASTLWLEINLTHKSLLYEDTLISVTHA